MIRTFLCVAAFLISVYGYSCSCRQSSGSYFLNQVKKFDAVVEGKFSRDSISWKGYLILDEVYKGAISKERIEIYEGGTDCTEIFDENKNVTYILGLYKFNDSNYCLTYLVACCVTSVLTVTNNFVVPEDNFHISNPRIGLFKNKMKKEKFIKRLKHRE